MSGYFVVRRLARYMNAVGQFVSQAKSRLLAASSRQITPVDLRATVTTLAHSPRMQDVLTERQEIEAQIDAAGRRGHVADALPVSLLVNRQAELAERKRLLADADQQLQTSLLRLDALCPIPPIPEPEPEPLAQPRARSFRRVGEWFPRGETQHPQ